MAGIELEVTRAVVDEQFASRKNRHGTNFSRNTIKTYNLAINQFLGYLEGRGIHIESRDYTEEVIGHLKDREIGYTTAKVQLAALDFLKESLKKEGIDFDFRINSKTLVEWLGMNPHHKKIVVPTHKQVNNLIEYLRESYDGCYKLFRDIVQIQLLAYGGLTAEEVVSLPTEALKVNDNLTVIEVRGETQKKNHRTVKIPLPEKFSELRSYPYVRKNMRAFEDRLFLNKFGRGINNTKTLRRNLEIYCKDAGEKEILPKGLEINPRTLRHYHTASLLQQGWTINEIAKRLGILATHAFKVEVSKSGLDNIVLGEELDKRVFPK